ncbi:unnamed protein product [Rodentolepis nana]|uniref:Uncharacterized protein n=1 Tax=Rodentolepis nana TaxID=102285 RepID=A0A0R3TZ91_RODNA|nr:unnamed protein product [Rodentolepis nana]
MTALLEPSRALEYLDIGDSHTNLEPHVPSIMIISISLVWASHQLQVMTIELVTSMVSLTKLQRAFYAN